MTGRREQSRSVAVEPLSKFLSGENVDVLKLDIEGYEGIVLRELGGSLRRIRQIVMEYHRWPDSIPLSQVLAALEANGHEYDVKFWRNEGSVATCLVSTWCGESPA